MTAPTEQLTAIAQRSIDATTTAVRTWTEALQAYAGSFSATNPLPRSADVQTAIDAWYTLVGQLLAEQRTLTTTVIDAGLDASGTITEQARTAVAALPFQPVAPFQPVVVADEPAPARAKKA